MGRFRPFPASAYMDPPQMVSHRETRRHHPDPQRLSLHRNDQQGHPSSRALISPERADLQLLTPVKRAP